MAARCRHPRLVAGACRVYGLVVWFYPSALRREFHRELTLTFRNRTEDVLNAGGIAAVPFFAMHLLVDWLRTFSFGTEEPHTLSLLGLGVDDDQACGCMDRTTFSVSLLLATLGVALLIGGWYGWLTLNAEILRNHRALWR
jgi:hypothetical protein